MATKSVAVSAVRPAGEIRATTWLENIFLFGIPAVCMYAAYYVISPALTPWMTLSIARMVAGGLVMFAMIVAALIGFAREGHPLTWSALAGRFRLNRMNRRIWLWTAGGIVANVLLSVAASALIPLVFSAIHFTPPIETAEPWGLSAVPIVLLTLALNILGEEFWWRGYILPRQELQFGKTAWVWHGILWSFFHAFKWWVIPAMMIVCMVVPFVAQRTRNTYPGMVSHLVVNGLGIFITIIQLLLK